MRNFKNILPTLFSWLFAKFYDTLMADAEERCLRDWRQFLLKNLSGTVLELGCGTGANLEFYPKTIKNLVLIEPNKKMRQKLAKKLLRYPYLTTTVINGNDEFIAFPDHSFDAVVVTLVLCSVKNLHQILSEIYRVLKPGAKLVFIEHVAAADHLNRFKWQKRLEPFWKIISCGCHLTRATEQNMAETGFKIKEITRQSMRGVPPIVRSSIHGYAVK